MTAPTTRDRIIERADALFYECGFEATSFADIARPLGLSRGNFYHHFQTKDAILDAVIARRMARTRAMLDGWQAGADSPRARLLCFVRMLLDNRSQIMAFGCPVGTLCTELAKRDHAAQAAASAILGLFRDWLEAQFRALGAGARADALALHLLTWSQGAAVIAAAFRDEALLRRDVARIEHWLDSQPDTAPHPQPEQLPCSSPS